MGSDPFTLSRPESGHRGDLPIAIQHEEIRAASTLLTVAAERDPVCQHVPLTVADLTPTFESQPGHEAPRRCKVCAHLAGAERILTPEARFHAVRRQDGKAVIRTFSGQEYLKDLAAMKQSVRERIWNPDVRVRESIASVWTPYDVWIDGKFSHCGIDSFDLVKTDEGWKIAGGTYTVEARCEPSPLGPVK